MQTREIKGTAVAPGLALGPVHVVHSGKDVPVWSVPQEEIPLEIGRLADALNAASERLVARQRQVAAAAGDKDAEIFAVHRLILQDPGAMRDVEVAITEQRINAEAAVKMLIDRFEETMGKLEGDSVRAYASDVSDPWRLVLELLLERDRADVLEAGEAVILAAAVLTPDVVTFIERDRILGVVAEKGGRFSHGAVLARAMGVPCVVGISNLLARLEQGMTLAVDGRRGAVHIQPSEDEVGVFLERKASFEARREELALESMRPAVSRDGEGLAVLVNIESVRDLDTFQLEQTDGVGLLRTEFLYLERNQFPSEEEQYRMYRRVLEHMGGRPTTIRLLDIGGDKPLPYFQTPPETNPALGWRGIRITLQWRDLLRVQVRALLRASTSGRLRVLLPMVSSFEELRDIYTVFHETREQLEEQGYAVGQKVEMGAMIEVPSALLTLGHLMEWIDFVSVGTNDLVQYLLAVDRDNSWVSSLYEPQHPAVMRALHLIAEEARRAGKASTVCGDMSADPAIAVLLLGMGFSQVSVAPQFIPEIKYAVRRIRADEARRFAQEALAERTTSGIQAVLERIRAVVYDDTSES